MKFKKILILLILFLACYANAKTYRRHIIVAVDCTSTFQNNPNKWELYNNFLGLTHNGRIEVSANLSDTLSLRREFQNNIIFFDPHQDELSLFLFGMPGNQRLNLWSKYRKATSVDKNELINTFCNSFIYKISSFKESNINDVESFLVHDLAPMFNGTNNIIKEFQNNNESGESLKKGITLSHYLYPCIINHLDCDKPALEYILVVFSDYMTGLSESDSGDKREVSYILSNYCFNQFIGYVNSLKSLFYRVDYFEFSSGNLMAKSYKIRPKAGTKSENATLSIESDLNIRQDSWGSETYTINSPLTMKFRHNDLFNVDSLFLKIYRNETCICSKLIGYRNKEKILVDINENTINNNGNENYIFKNLKFGLSGVASPDSFDELNFTITASGKYEYMNGVSLPVCYETQRIISPYDIDFRNPIILEILKMLVITIILLIVVAVIVYLVMNGKKKRLELCFNYSDCLSGSFTDVSRNGGILSLPCDFVDDGHTIIRYAFRGSIKNNAKYSIPWNVNYIYMKPSINANLCRYASVKIENADDSGWMYVLVRNNSFDFNLIVELNIPDIREIQTIEIGLSTKYSPYFLSFRPLPFKGVNSLNVYSEKMFTEIYKNKKVGFNDFLENTIFDYNEYKVYSKRYVYKKIDSDHWLGIDPGTNGSCMTIGNGATGDAGNPKIYPVKIGEESIFASLIILAGKHRLKDSQIAQLPIGQWKPNRDYVYGNEAEGQVLAYKSIGAYCYRSIKKLLGYKKGGSDGQITATIDKKIYYFSGLDLQSLLIRALNQILENHLKSVMVDNAFCIEKNDIFPDGRQVLERAVVAIPNNYQLPQILDMINSVKSVGRFEEVKFIYEPEGILYHYLSKTYHSHHSNGSENIIVFDMGGATVNATVFKVIYKKQNDHVKYYVETLARLGYAVGGDDIDYAILEFLMSFEKFGRYFRTDAMRYLYQDKNKSRLIDLVQRFKIAFTKMCNNESQDMLATLDNFMEVVINKLCDKVNYSHEEYKNGDEFLEYKGDFKKALRERLLSCSWMKNYVYDKIGDAVNDMLDTQDVKAEAEIHKILYSGRSTLFPMIKEKVKDSLSYNRFSPTEYPLSHEEIKTAVAEGACWFGIYEGKIVHVDNSRVTSSYGFRYTRPNEKDYIEMVRQNSRYGENGCITDTKSIASDFPSNAGHVGFYQVMGSLHHGKSIFESENKHKVRFLTAINLSARRAISENIKIMENGSVYCDVDYEGKQPNIRPRSVDFDTRDITNENDRPYLFSVTDKEDYVSDIKDVQSALSDSWNGNGLTVNIRNSRI